MVDLSTDTSNYKAEFFINRPMRLEKLDSSSIVMGIPLLNPITTGWGPQDS